MPSPRGSRWSWPSAAASVELAVSGTVPLRVALPAMVSVHMVIGLGEADHRHRGRRRARRPTRISSRAATCPWPAARAGPGRALRAAAVACGRSSWGRSSWRSPWPSSSRPSPRRRPTDWRRSPPTKASQRRHPRNRSGASLRWAATPSRASQREGGDGRRRRRRHPRRCSAWSCWPVERSAAAVRPRKRPLSDAGHPASAHPLGGHEHTEHRHSGHQPTPDGRDQVRAPVSGTHHFLTDERFAQAPSTGWTRGRRSSASSASPSSSSPRPPRPPGRSCSTRSCCLPARPCPSAAGVRARRSLVVVPFVLMVAVFLPFFHRAGAGGYSLGGLRVSG